jgi:hypothetical protein
MLEFQESALQQNSSGHPNCHQPSATVCANNLQEKKKERKKMNKKIEKETVHILGTHKSPFFILRGLSEEISEWIM